MNLHGIFALKLSRHLLATTCTSTTSYSVPWRGTMCALTCPMEG
uniref:Uncharacterized protein n=1 Tax=Setaria viridis TaxID=4556 RepID=A0A4U6TGJ9_SETVI|nr:hypothetical protein SEVIR_8G090550v2 [Setaria viridis]